MAPSKEDILQGIVESHGITPEKCTVISRRLFKELQGLESAGIPYQISYQPIYRSSFGNRNLVEIKMMYRDHNLFIVLGDYYPFQPPIFLIDQVCNVTKDCRIRDGLERLSIFPVTEMILEFAVGVDTYPSVEGDLVSPKQMAEIWIGQPSWDSSSPEGCSASRHRKDRVINDVKNRIRSLIPHEESHENSIQIDNGSAGAGSGSTGMEEENGEGNGEGERNGEVEVEEPLLPEEEAQNFASEQEKLSNYMMRFTNFHHPTTTMVKAHAMMIECFEYY